MKNSINSLGTPRGFALFLCAALSTFNLMAQSYRLSTAARLGHNGDNGPATEAALLFPRGLAVARDGTVYVAQIGHHRVRRVTPNGVIATYAGTGVAGFRGDGGGATDAQINSPAELALDPKGSLYVLDQGNGRVRRIDPDGKIQTVAGKGGCGNNVSGPATELQFCNLGGITVDSAGNLYISEMDGVSEHVGHRVWRVDASGMATIYAGPGSASGSLTTPTCLAFDGAGNLYICDLGYIRRRAPSGQLTTIYGANSGVDHLILGTQALNQGPQTPTCLAADSQGNVYFGTGFGSNPSAVYAIRGGILNLVAGLNQVSSGGYDGEDGSRLSRPGGLAFDGAGNLYISDYNNHRIRRLSERNVMSTIAGSRRLPQGSTAPLFQFGASVSVVAAPDGAVYFADWALSQLRKIAPDGRVTLVAGNGFTSVTGEGPSTSAGLGPSVNAIALDGSGNLYSHSFETFILRQISSDGRIRTIAGSGRRGGAVDDVSSLAVDPSGILHFSDRTAIRRVSAGSVSTAFGARTGSSIAFSPAGVLHFLGGDRQVYRVENGVAQRVAGTLNPKPGLINDGLPATDAFLPFPTAIAFDRLGNLYIAGSVVFGGPGAVWRVGPDGIQRRIAGPADGPVSPDGTPAQTAAFERPLSISVDASGKIYLASGFAIRVLVPATAQACTVRPSQTALDVPNAGGDSRIEVIASAYLCPWEVRTPASWIAPSVSSAAGSGAVSLSVQRNTGEAREATVFIGENPIVVRQPPGHPLINGIAGVGGRLSSVRALSPGGLLVLDGEGFLAAGQAGSSVPDGERRPEVLQKTCVLVDGVRALLAAVSSTQIQFISPRLETKVEADVVVVRNCEQPNEIRSAARKSPYQPAAPEFLYAERNSDGNDPVLASRDVDGSPVGRHSFPATPGDVIIVFAVGFGLTDPPVELGAAPSDLVPIAAPVRVRLGGALLSAEDVIYAGVQPGFPGLFQLKLRIPESSPAGDLPLTVFIGDIGSPPGVYLTVGRAAL